MGDYFRNDAGQRWSLTIDDAARERILDRCFFQAPKLATYRAEAYMELYQSLLAERWKVVECLWAVCTPQAQRRGVTREAFEHRLAGCYLEAEAALFYSFAEAFPENRANMHLQYQLLSEMRDQDHGSA